MRCEGGGGGGGGGVGGGGGGGGKVVSSEAHVYRLLADHGPLVSADMRGKGNIRPSGCQGGHQQQCSVELAVGDLYLSVSLYPHYFEVLRGGNGRGGEGGGERERECVLVTGVQRPRRDKERERERERERVCVCV